MARHILEGISYLIWALITGNTRNLFFGMIQVLPKYEFKKKL